MVAGRSVDVKVWKAANLQADTGYVNNFLNSLQMSTKFLNEFENTQLSSVAKKLNMSMQEAQNEFKNIRNGIHPIRAKSAAFLREMGLIASTSGSKSLQYQGAAVAAGLGVRLSGKLLRYNCTKSIR